MSVGIDKLASELQKVIEEKDKNKKTPYDTEAEVVRVDTEVVWVKIPGGVDETPVQKTVNAKVGDIVQVRVSGGRAFLVGNGTNPPTDDTRANEASYQAQNAQVHAVNAEAAAADAQKSAESARIDASVAHQMAENATESANEAKAEAERANRAANGAVTSLGIVQGVVDGLSLDMDDLQTHIAMMDPVVDPETGKVIMPSGLHVVPTSNGYFIVLSNDGMYVYDNISTLVATFGENIKFNSDRPQRVGGDNAYIEYYDSNNDGKADSIRIVGASIDNYVSNSEVISKINQSPESITIDANKVNIDGAAIFTSGRLSETSLNNAYDAKGAAEEAVTVIDGANIITGTVTADKLDTTDINASGALTVGALSDETRSEIAPGRNLFRCTIKPDYLGHSSYRRPDIELANGWMLGSNASNAAGTGSDTEDAIRIDYTDDYGEGPVFFLVYPNAVKNNVDYTLSFTYRGNIDKTGPIYAITDTTTYSYSSYENFNLDSSGEWTHFEGVVNWTNIPSSKNIIGVQLLDQSGDDLWIEIKNESVKLEVGKKATQWIPAREELASTATAYITKIDKNGIEIHPESTKNNSAKINADGMEIKKGGASVAFYGDTARIGKLSSIHTNIQSNGMDVWTGSEDDANHKAAHFGRRTVVGPPDRAHVVIAPDYSDGASNSELIQFRGGEDNTVYAKMHTDSIHIGLNLNDGRIGLGGSTFSGTMSGWAASGYVEGYIYNADQGKTGAVSDVRLYNNVSNGAVYEAKTRLETYWQGENYISVDGRQDSYESGWTGATTRIYMKTNQIYMNAGIIRATTNIIQSSDKRLKDHVSYLEEDACEFVRNLKPAFFKKNDMNNVGFYAQDVEEIDPWKCFVKSDSDGFKFMDYISMVAPLTAYCQNLEKKIDALEKRIEALEKGEQ